MADNQGYALWGGQAVKITPLEATESGTYKAPKGQAFNPVTVTGGGGGAGNGLVIRVTYDGGEYTLDKTYEDIYDFEPIPLTCTLVYDDNSSATGIVIYDDTTESYLLQPAEFRLQDCEGCYAYRSKEN